MVVAEQLMRHSSYSAGERMKDGKYESGRKDDVGRIFSTAVYLPDIFKCETIQPSILNLFSILCAKQCPE